NLWCSSPSRVGFAGESFTYIFDVSYVGVYSFIDLSLYVEGVPSSWSYKFIYNGFEVDMIRLLNETRVNLQLIVDVPSSASPGEYSFKIVVEYVHYPYRSYLNCRAIVKPTVRDLDVFCMFPAKAVWAGSSVEFELNLHYFGPEDTFNFTVMNLPSGWSVYFIHGSDEILLLSLNDGDTASIKAVFEIPADAEIGDYNLTLIIFSKFISRKVNLIVRVKPPSTFNRGLRLSVDYPIIDIETGRFAYFTLTVNNVGAVDEIVYLSVSEKPSGWEVSFIVSGKKIHGLSVPARSFSNVIVEAKPPPYVELGEHKFIITAESEDGAISANITLIVNIYGKYSLSLHFPEFPSPYFSMKSGETKRFEVEVKNNGVLNVTNIYLTLEVPSIDWEVNIEPQKIMLLQPGESVTFQVEMYVSTIVSAGDYFITVKAVSDQASASKDLRISITKPTEWGYIGAALAVIAIVIVVIIFKRAGRR
ncbi:MAG: hypothetical protein DRJ30_06975, partial [Candidatus Methanomethylicota archaeon]